MGESSVVAFVAGHLTRGATGARDRGQVHRQPGSGGQAPDRSAVAADGVIGVGACTGPEAEQLPEQRRDDRQLSVRLETKFCADDEENTWPTRPASRPAR